MPNQTENGKAFEYACVNAIFEKYKGRLTVALEESSQMVTARRFYDLLGADERNAYDKGARAAAKIIDRLEPMLSDGSTSLRLKLQTDQQGIHGDVRDVLCVRDGKWEIGLSCKHNHEAVKHSRLSARIDFGTEWFGIGCSKEYFAAVRKVFDPLRVMREQSAIEGHPAKWGDLEDKENSVYRPVLDAFIDELKKLDAANPGIIPARLIKYLIGRNDFYKVIMNDRRGYTQIETVNINGTLGQPHGKTRPLVDVPKMKLPTKFYEIGYKQGSNNTIVVVCDEGWNISMRIHNASSKIEPSLKFDVQLLAVPGTILSQIEPWGE